MADTLVIVPTYNELASLPPILGRIRQCVPDAHILVIDDSSPDGTGELADRIAHADSFITVLHREVKEGLGRAYLSGFRFGISAGYRYIVEIDADGSHDPQELTPMLSLAHAGADLVLGSRWIDGGSVRNWPWIRKAISRAGNSYSRAMLGSKIHDLTSGFRVYRSDALSRIADDSVMSQGYCFQIELAWLFERNGLAVVEHPIVFVERAEGQSKMRLGIVIEALARVTLWGITRRRW